MEKFFNTAGPQKLDLNYSIDPLSRIDLDDVLTLIRQQRYFVLHAPRQTGKDTMLTAYLRRLSEALPKPVVLFIDEIDALVGDSLVSVRGM